MAKCRIGIMGGSFNPIHRRHLQIAACALDEVQLDRILFIPNGNPPHKNSELADPLHRYEMTRLAVMPYDKFSVSDIEQVNNGIMYTADTLKKLHGRYKDAEFFFIIGEDSLFELEHWMRPLEVFALCSFVVCMRYHHDISDHPYVKGLQSKGAVFHYLSLDPLDISASAIRRQIKDGTISDALLTPEVCEYIRVMHLYGCTEILPNADHDYGMLKESLSDSRLLHSLAVAYTAHRLALIHHLDVETCEMAALLHDCAKCIPLKEQQMIACEAKLKLSATELRSVGLLHGPVGAVIAQTKYGIDDPVILTAIATHTTGYVGMTALDMVIFLADKIEPYRKPFPALESIRSLARQDLYKATYSTIQSSIQYVTNASQPLHPATHDILQWLKEQINERGDSQT